MTDVPFKLKSDLKISVSEEEQLKGLKEKFLIYKSPIATDHELDKIVFQMQPTETLTCGCIRFKQRENLFGPYFEMKVDKRRITANDAGKHEILVYVKDDQFWYSRN